MIAFLTTNNKSKTGYNFNNVSTVISILSLDTTLVIILSEHGSKMEEISRHSLQRDLIFWFFSSQFKEVMISDKRLSL